MAVLRGKGSLRNAMNKPKAVMPLPLERVEPPKRRGGPRLWSRPGCPLRGCIFTALSLSTCPTNTVTFTKSIRGHFTFILQSPPSEVPSYLVFLASIKQSLQAREVPFPPQRVPHPGPHPSRRLSLLGHSSHSIVTGLSLSRPASPPSTHSELL